MNPILLSFLCGAAFIGGAAATLTLAVLANGVKSKKDREELFGYWRKSLEKHDEQIAAISKAADAIVAMNDRKSK